MGSKMDHPFFDLEDSSRVRNLRTVKPLFGRCLIFDSTDFD